MYGKCGAHMADIVRRVMNECNAILLGVCGWLYGVGVVLHMTRLRYRHFRLMLLLCTRLRTTSGYEPF